MEEGNRIACKRKKKPNAKIREGRMEKTNPNALVRQQKEETRIREARAMETSKLKPFLIVLLQHPSPQLKYGLGSSRLTEKSKVQGFAVGLENFRVGLEI